MADFKTFAAKLLSEYMCMRTLREQQVSREITTGDDSSKVGQKRRQNGPSLSGSTSPSFSGKSYASNSSSSDSTAPAKPTAVFDGT